MMCIKMNARGLTASVRKFQIYGCCTEVGMRVVPEGGEPRLIVCNLLLFVKITIGRHELTKWERY